jgi:hypothetical protein
MLALTRFRILVALMVPALAQPAAFAQPSSGTAGNALSIVPAQAPIVVHIHGVDRVKDRLTALIKSALPDLGPMVVAKLEESLKEALDEKKLQGLDKEGPIFVVFLEIPGDDTQVPKMAVIARVAKYAEFRDGLLNDDERKALKPAADGAERTEIKGQEVFFLDRSGWAIVTPHKDTATGWAKNNTGLDSKINRDLARRLLESDVGVYVNLSAINKQFGDQIKEAKETMFNLFDQFGGQNANTMEMAKKMYGGMFQVVADGRACVISLEFRPEGLSFHLAVNVGSDTATNKFLKDQKPTGFSEFGTLPAGQIVYSAAEFVPNMLKMLAPMMYGVSAGGDSQKELQSAIEQLIESGNMTTLSAGSFPATSLQASNFKNPALAANAQLKLFRSLGDGAMFQNSVIRGKPEIKENDQSYRGFTLHFVHVNWDFDKALEQFGGVGGGGDEVKKALTKLIGEGLNTWFGTDGKQFLTISAKSWDDAKRQIDAYLDGKETIGSVKAFAASRTQLPHDATLLALVDAGRFAFAMGDYMLASVKAVGGAIPLPFNLPESMKPVKTTPAFLGIAVVLQPEYGSFDFYLPVTAVHEIRRVIMPLFMGGD